MDGVMRILARELGALDIPEGARLYMPHGLLGFEGRRHYALVELEDFHPFALLVCEEDPEIMFAVTDAERFGAGAAEVHLSQLDESALDLEDGDSIAVFVIVSLTEDGHQATGNLRAPIVMNVRNRVARQIIVYGAGLSMRQPIRPRRRIPLHVAVSPFSVPASPGKGKF